MAEKTEKATPKKLKDARKKGQVAKSQDLPGAFTFIVSIWVVLGMSQFLFHQMGEFLTATYKAIPKGNLEEVLPDFFMQSFSVIFVASIPSLAFVSFIGFMVTFLSVGPVFAPEVFKFDIKKFNPVDNLKAKFKLKTLVELLKSVLKISIATYIIYDVTLNSLPVITKTISMPIYGALVILHSFLIEVVIKVGLFFLIVAVADFAYQKHSFASEMKMEKFEVKQEYKNMEGDPHIKSKRRQIAQEVAYQDGPAGGVKRAQTVVTNPTHLAIAIGYQREYDAAPYILAMGEGLLADRIIKLAEMNKIPVVRNIKLAHKLWEDGDLHEFIPETTYEPVAHILRWISSLKDNPTAQLDEDLEFMERE